MNTPILTKYFEQWMRSVFGAEWKNNLPEIEQTERQRAFFSGFASYYFFAMAIVALPDAEADRAMRDLSAEIKSYFEQMKRVPMDPRAN